MRKYVGKPEILKSLNTLAGIIAGIKCDDLVNSKESVFLKDWLAINHETLNRKPFIEIVKKVESVLSDGILTLGEVQEISEQLDYFLDSKSQYHSEVTREVQKILGKVEGILCDGILNKTEISHLSAELDSKSDLFPFGEIKSMLAALAFDHSQKEIEKAS